MKSDANFALRNRMSECSGDVEFVLSYVVLQEEVFHFLCVEEEVSAKKN